MTPCEQAAFAADVQAACQAAMTVAVTIEVRDDAREVGVSACETIAGDPIGAEV